MIFGSEILVQSDFFEPMKDAGFFWVVKKKTEEFFGLRKKKQRDFLGCKKRTKGFFRDILKK